MTSNIPQLATAKISCNGEVGTAVLFFPGSEQDYVYIFTAKHCLFGKNFDREFRKRDITLQRIFNATTRIYHSYTLTETDIVITSDDQKDMALLILSKNSIVSLTGQEFYYPVIDIDPAVVDYQIRGFASFNEQKADRPFPVKLVEQVKDNPDLFLLKSEQNMDTYYQQALDNVQGLSGSGAFAIFKNNFYLGGIVHEFEDGSLFTASKILALNNLIPSDRFVKISQVKVETNEDVLVSYRQMGENEQRARLRSKDTIGDVHVPRDIKPLIHLLKTSRIAVIYGKPGMGKSALASSLINNLKTAEGISVITFTAEQLYFPTLKEALQKAGYTASFEQIIQSPLSGKKMLVWIESFEKLMESGIDGAFIELLQASKTHYQLWTVITIRDYLLQKFKVNYRHELFATDIFYPVSEFKDDEVTIIRQAVPKLIPLLDNSKIHHLLRTPYYLDKAVRIIPELLLEEHLDEILFKKLMWEHIVEAGNEERGRVFSSICLKRAREMSLYTCSDEARELITSLVHDNILQVEDGELADRYSPSHDILEDWTLIRFIKMRYRDATNWEIFITSLESIPAIRRAFRLWLDEFYAYEPQNAAEFVYDLLVNSELKQHWKDELTIVSLRSQYAGPLFKALQMELIADEGTMFKRIIQLLETGCKTVDSKTQNLDDLHPVGSGWDLAIDFIWENYKTIQNIPDFEEQFVRLISSWSKKLPNFNPLTLPSAAKNAALLLKDFINRYQKRLRDGHGSVRDRSALQQCFAILFKLTGAVPETIEDLLDAAITPSVDKPHWADEYTLERVRNYMTSGVMSDQLCKYFPDKVLNFASEQWMTKKKESNRGLLIDMIQEHPSIMDFGVNEDLQKDYDPSSGYQTFFYWMFLHHPDKALDFLIPFLNKAFQKNQKIRIDEGGDIEHIHILYFDGNTKTYFGNSYYWGMYRGIDGTNRLITSLLMALEAGLLDLAANESAFQQVQKYLSRLIKESNNVALLAIVSSLFQAFPDLLNELSVSLLGIPLFFHWDANRSHHELMSDPYNSDPFEKQERLRSNQLPHRKKYYLGLVGFVAYYMFYVAKHNEALFKQVDVMWSNATADDILWKKFLFDMDARKYVTFTREDDDKRIVQLMPGYDEQTKSMVFSKDQASITPPAHSLWARNAFEGGNMTDRTYEGWKNCYTSLIDQNQRKDDFMTMPGTLATVGLRDFFDQLTSDELQWCCEKLIRLAECHLNTEDHFNKVVSVMDKNPAMYGISLVFKTELIQALDKRAKNVIFRLLISDLDDRPKKFLQAGIANHLSKSQPKFTMQCWYGLLEEISHLRRDTEIKRSIFPGFVDNENQEVEKKWAAQLTKSVVEGKIKPITSVEVSLDDITNNLLDDALRIIPPTTELLAQYDFIQKLLHLHLNFLRKNKKEYKFSKSRSAFIFFYPRYLLNQPQDLAKRLFIELLDHTLQEEPDDFSVELSDFLSKVVKEHIRAVTSGAPKGNFWVLWELLRQWIIEHKKALLLPAFLMDIDWTEDSESWDMLEGRKLYYKSFILDWGHNNINSSIKFLNGIAFNQFMPDSVSWIARMLRSQRADELNVELAGRFVQKAFYRYGNKIKRDKNVLSDFLTLLDFLIAKGLSKAYVLREELIQFK